MIISKKFQNRLKQYINAKKSLPELMIEKIDTEYYVYLVKEKIGKVAVDYKLKDICSSLTEVFDNYGQYFNIGFVLNGRGFYCNDRKDK